eukprot:6623244-Prymnesium_polylepis.1
MPSCAATTTRPHVTRPSANARNAAGKANASTPLRARSASRMAMRRMPARGRSISREGLRTSSGRTRRTHSVSLRYRRRPMRAAAPSRAGLARRRARRGPRRGRP